MDKEIQAALEAFKLSVQKKNTALAQIKFWQAASETATVEASKAKSEFERIFNLWVSESKDQAVTELKAKK